MKGVSISWLLLVSGRHVIKSMFRRFNNALEKRISLIRVMYQTWSTESKSTKFMTVCDVLWHPALTQISVIQVAVDKVVPSTHRNAWLPYVVSLIHLFSPIRASVRHIIIRNKRASASGSLLFFCRPFSQILHHVNTTFREVWSTPYTSMNRRRISTSPQRFTHKYWITLRASTLTVFSVGLSSLNRMLNSRTVYGALSWMYEDIDGLSLLATLCKQRSDDVISRENSVTLSFVPLYVCCNPIIKITALCRNCD
jgi:hypothetical protein